MSDIFSYDDPVDYLNHVFALKKKRNPRFSIRSWARQAGLPHGALLTLVLGGKRRLLPPFADTLARSLHLSAKEERYFHLLVNLSNARSEKDRELYQRLLAALAAERTYHLLELDQIRILSHWAHLAILELTFLDDFRDDPAWIARRLRDKVDARTVAEAISRLERVGLLERRPEDGRLVKASPKLRFEGGAPNLCLRQLHRQLIELALQAIDEQDLAARDITGHVTVTTKERARQAARMIRDFRFQLAEFLQVEQGDCVYQLNVQFFALTEPVAEIGTSS